MEHGELEAFVDLDGNEFIIERFPTGSILNSRQLITEDRMFLQVRAVKATYLLKFSKKLQLDLISKYSDLNIRFLKYNDMLLKQGKAYPLDILLSTEPC